MLRQIIVAVAMVAVVAADEELSCKDADGQEHPDGSTFRSADGCNRCSCYRGAVGCTQMACVPPQGCNYKGNLYLLGQEFRDDCNTCLCGENGEVGCTRMYCPLQCEEGDQKYDIGDIYTAADGCNTCKCLKGGVSTCTRKVCH